MDITIIMAMRAFKHVLQLSSFCVTGCDIAAIDLMQRFAVGFVGNNI